MIRSSLALLLFAFPVCGDDFSAHLKELKTRLPGKQFTVVVEKPFVVIGDESAAMVKRRSSGTIAWAVKHLKKDYFEKDPNHIVDIWLFKDKRSYEDHVKELWGTRPGTPYGYYSPTHKVLVMNISTGGGTLVHELVHPFVEANFPDCPSWFNEGLASLYEQCGERKGKITGFTNWRLAGLQKSIRNKECDSFKELCGSSSEAFYHNRGCHYAQARYLCYYLQQRGLLRGYYRAFRDRSGKDDPSGYQTLQEVLDVKDMAAWQKKWETWVLGLRYPEG